MRTLLKWLPLMLVAVVVVGCSSAATAAPAGTAAEEPSTVEDAPAAAERPSEPAGESFRADDVSHIAATGRPQLVEFFAFWCSTCARVRPIVHALEAEYWGEVDFVYLDIDDPDNREAMSEYGFTSQPYFVLLDEDGEVQETFFGYQTEETFRPALDALLDS